MHRLPGRLPARMTTHILLTPRRSARLSRIISYVVLGIVFLAPRPAFSQQLPDVIVDAGAEYAELYLQPVVNAFGADINGGLIHTAKVGGGALPFDLFLGIKVMGALIPDIDRTLNIAYETPYVFHAPDGNQYNLPVTFQINDGPTVFGDTSPGIVTGNIRQTVHPGADGLDNTPDDIVIDSTLSFNVLPGLYDGSIAPLAVPQLGIGSLAGTDLIVRYLPRVRHENYGHLEFVGIGLRHSVDRYIPSLPFRIAGHFMMQRLLITSNASEEILVASSLAAGIAVSKTFVFLTLYAGIQTEETTVAVDYTFGEELSEIEGENISFELTGDTTLRGMAGASLKLGPFLVNVEASQGNNRTVLAAGVGLAL